MSKKRSSSNVKYALYAIAVAFVAIQFAPVERENPPSEARVFWRDQATEQTAREACYDCHSNETDYPWYAYVAPVSWKIAADVNEGREHMNFSLDADDDRDEAAEIVREGEMPLWSYTLLGPDADLTEEERETFAAGLEKTFSEEVTPIIKPMKPEREPEAQSEPTNDDDGLRYEEREITPSETPKNSDKKNEGLRYD
jgi:mono/diheme cytochrome c family protein